jgi:hypothetical protein
MLFVGFRLMRDFRRNAEKFGFEVQPYSDLWIMISTAVFIYVTRKLFYKVFTGSILQRLEDLKDPNF